MKGGREQVQKRELQNYETLVALRTSLRSLLEELYIIKKRLERAEELSWKENTKTAEECLLSIEIALRDLPEIKEKLEKLCGNKYRSSEAKKNSTGVSLPSSPTSGGEPSSED